MFNREKIIEKIKSLYLPVNEFVVVGGGSLAAQGLRETSDIDIICTESLFLRLQESGWPWKMRPDGKPSLKRENVEIYLEVNAGDFQPSFEELKSRAITIEDIPFISLADARAFKKAYGREKDLIDIRLIDNFLDTSSKS